MIVRELTDGTALVISQEAHAAHSQIVLAGIICTLIFFDTRRGDSQAQRFAQAGLFAVVLLVAGWGLHAVFPISKIYATPTWCLWCAAICVALFALLHWLIDLRGRGQLTHRPNPQTFPVAPLVYLACCRLHPLQAALWRRALYLSAAACD